MKLKPVEHDPFQRDERTTQREEPPPRPHLRPVDHDPFAPTPFSAKQPSQEAKTPKKEPKLKPVNFDPFQEQEDDYSYLEAAGRNLKGGYAEMASGLGTVSNYLGERFDSDTLRQTGESMKDYWGEVAESAPLSEAAQESPFDDPKVLADPRWWTENVSRMAPSFAIPAGVAGGGMKIASKALPGLPRVASALGAGVGGLFGGALEGAQTYEAGLESGQPEETAASAGEAMALGSAVLNALPFYKIMNPSARGVVYNFLTRGMTEGVTEAMEEPLDEAIQGLVYDKEMDWEDVARRMAHVAPPAFLLGGATGGGQGATQPAPQTPEDADISGTVEDSIEDADLTPDTQSEAEPLSDVQLTGEDQLATQMEQAFPGERADNVAPISGEEIVMEGGAAQPQYEGPVDEEIEMYGYGEQDVVPDEPRPSTAGIEVEDQTPPTTEGLDVQELQPEEIEATGLTADERERTIQALEQELEPQAAQPETAPSQPAQEQERSSKASRESSSPNQPASQGRVAQPHLLGDTVEAPTAGSQVVNTGKVVSDLVSRIGKVEPSASKNFSEGVGGQPKSAGNTFATRSLRKQIKDFVDIPAKSDGAASIDPALDKAVGDGFAADTHFFGNTRNAQAIRSKGFDSLNVKRKAVVENSMRSAFQDSEVRKSVVELVPVDVMDVLIAPEGSTQSLLNKKSMLLDRLATSRAFDDPVFIGRLADAIATSLPRSLALRVTEEVSSSVEPPLAPSEGSAAVGTRDRRHKRDSSTKGADEDQKKPAKPKKKAKKKASKPTLQTQAGDRTVTFKPNPRAESADEAQTTVMLDTDRLDAALQREMGMYLPRRGRGESEVEGRRQQAREFIESGETIEAPIVRSKPGGTVALEDGRHRFAALRDMGAEQVAVTVNESEAAELQERFTAPKGEQPSLDTIRKAHAKVADDKGYPDVLINEVYEEVGGDRRAFLDAVEQAARDGKVVANVGDWSLSTPEERRAAVYINGQPHLRMRVKQGRDAGMFSVESSLDPDAAPADVRRSQAMKFFARARDKYEKVLNALEEVRAASLEDYDPIDIIQGTRDTLEIGSPEETKAKELAKQVKDRYLSSRSLSGEDLFNFIEEIGDRPKSEILREFDERVAAADEILSVAEQYQIEDQVEAFNEGLADGREDIFPEDYVENFRAGKNLYEKYKHLIENDDLGEIWIYQVQEHIMGEGTPPMFSTGQSPSARGMTTESAHNSLRQILGKKAYDRLVASGRFEILRKPSEVVEGLTAKEDANVKGRYDPDQDKSYLFADNIAPDELWGVFLHEVGAHYGLPKMIGREEYNRVTKQLQNLYKLGNKRVVAAYNRVPKNTPQQYQWDEVLAYLAQEKRNHNMGLVRRVIAKIKEFLRSRGYLKAGKLSPDEITRLVVGAATHAARTALKSATRGAQTDTALQSAPADTFYSQMARAIEAKLPKKGNAQSYATQIRNLAKKGEFKQEELEWSGVLEWLDNFKRTPSMSERMDEELLNIEAERSKVVTKAEVLDFLRANRIRVEEVTKSERSPFPKGENELSDDSLNEILDEEPAQESEGERREGRPKFGEYQLPGGENYRELLLTLPPKQADPLEFEVIENAEGNWDVVDEDGRVIRTRDNYRSALDDSISMSTASVDTQDAKANFYGGHFNEPNVLAHVRFNERTDADGNRVLFVEEVQSDFHQAGRKKGYKSDAKMAELRRRHEEVVQQRAKETDTEAYRRLHEEEMALIDEMNALHDAVPDAPFKQTWPLLAMKRMIRYAAENGFDKVAWTTGEQQADRYDLSKRLSSIDYVVQKGIRPGEDRYNIVAKDHDNNAVVTKSGLTEQELEDHVGKEIADKIVNSNELSGSLSGLDLKVGGKGMKAFYDKMLPSALNKYAKKWGARVGTAEIQTQPERYSFDKAYINAAKDFKVNGHSRGEAARGLEKAYPDASPREIAAALDNVYGVDQSVHALPITPQMREAVMEVGQPLFSKEESPEQKRERLRRMGMDFEDLPGDLEGNPTQAQTPEDVEPETVDPETALEELERQGFDKPMLSVDEEGPTDDIRLSGTLPKASQQERAQRSLSGNRANKLTTDEDGLLNEDPRMDPLSRDLIKTVGFFESATDKLRRSKHPILQNLAHRVDTYYDRNEARMGWVNGRVRPILNRIPMTQKKHVMRDFKDYWRHFDNGRGQEAAAILNRSPQVRELVSEVKRLYGDMGDVNQKVGVQVYDAGLNEGKGGWRGIGKVPEGRFWPRAFSPEVQRVLSNPKNDPKLWDKLVSALIDEGHIETREEADKYLRRYMGREVANDYFSGIEKARQRKLPEVFYDYSWDAFNRYARKWSSRVTQIEQFGQKTGPGSEDVFEQVINSTKDQHTQNYVAALSDHVYSRRSTDIYTTLLQHLNLIATGTQLGNPATATLNFIGGTTLNVQMFGWRRVAKSYATMLRDWKRIQQTGVDLGILGKDVLNILRDTEQSAATYMDASGRVQDSLARFAAFTMKWGGYKGTENIIRMNAMMSSWIQLQDALQRWNRNPKSSTSMKYRAFMQRNRIDPDKLLAENGKGPETARYLRRMVNIPQGSYRPDMVPLYVDSPVGRFLFKYQKFGTQVSRMFWQNHLQPFVKTVAGGEKVLLPGQKLQPKTGNIIDEKTGKVVKSNRVRTFLPLLRYFATALLGGSAILAARSFMFNYNDPGPEWDDLAEALDDDDEGEDRSLMWAMIFDRAYYSMFAASAAGFFGNYIQFGMDFADQQRVKNPLDPPGLASIDAVVELVMRSQEQGKLTARDLDNIGEQTLALYRGYKRMGTKAMAMSGSGWKEARLRDAYTDLVYTKKMTRRFADQMDMKGRRTFSGRWGKTPMSPYNQQAYEALLLGDPESARAAFKQARQEMEEPGKVSRSMKSSVRARHPWNIGASQARANHSKFLQWAEKHTSKSNYQRILEIGRRYDKARSAAGL